MGFFDKIKNLGIFGGRSEITEDLYDELEEKLILADMGMDATLRAVEELRGRVRKNGLKRVEDARAAMQDILVEMLEVGDPKLNLRTMPSFILFIGVNGVGKTTTIGKIGAQLKAEGKKVLFAAADTFRAAASEQLTIWAQRSGIDIVKQGEGADPAAVVFDSIAAARARWTDVVLVDTAGRLHNKANLMGELAKMGKVIDRECPRCSKEVLLVLDATTGQNGLVQAKQFMETSGVTGIVLTKLDGTAKGGIAITISDEFDLPIKYIGVGEGMEDLVEFDPLEFAGGIFSE